MKTFKKLIVVVCAVMVACSLGNIAYGADAFKITFLAPFYQAQPPSMTSGVIAKWEGEETYNDPENTSFT